MTSSSSFICIIAIILFGICFANDNDNRKFAIRELNEIDIDANRLNNLAKRLFEFNGITNSGWGNKRSQQTGFADAADSNNNRDGYRVADRKSQFADKFAATFAKRRTASFAKRGSTDFDFADGSDDGISTVDLNKLKQIINDQLRRENVEKKSLPVGVSRFA